MSLESGFILLYESIIHDKLVGFKKPFKKSEAWIWLLIEACRKKEGRNVLRDFGGKERMVFEPYGCVCHSERFLAKAWGWGKTATRGFIKKLEIDEKIIVKVNQQINCISICKFYVYQNRQTSKQTSSEPAANQQRTSSEPNYNTLTRKHENKKDILSDGSASNHPKIKNEYSENFKKFWSAMRSDMKSGKKQAFRHYKASVKNQQDYDELNQAYRNYLNTRKVRDGFVMNGSTFMNNWRDYLEYQDINNSNQNARGESPQELNDRLAANIKDKGEQKIDVNQYQMATAFFYAHKNPSNRSDNYKKYASMFPDEETLREFVAYWTQKKALKEWQDKENQLWKNYATLNGGWNLEKRIKNWIRK